VITEVEGALMIHERPLGTRTEAVYVKLGQREKWGGESAGGYVERHLGASWQGKSPLFPIAQPPVNAKHFPSLSYHIKEPSFGRVT
jgi:hypothetical protein